MEEPYLSQLATALAAIIAVLVINMFYRLYKHTNILPRVPSKNIKRKKYIRKALRAIFPVVKPDPVKHCEIYKREGCAHVDGPHCDIQRCNPEMKDSRVIHIKKEE